jgi:hypothetical protein
MSDTAVILNANDLGLYDLLEERLFGKPRINTKIYENGTPVMAVNEKRSRIYLGLGSVHSYDRHCMNLMVIRLDDNGIIVGKPKFYPNSSVGTIPHGDVMQISHIIYSQKYNKLYILFTKFQKVITTNGTLSESSVSYISSYDLDSNGDILGEVRTLRFSLTLNPDADTNLNLQKMVMHPYQPFMYLVGFGHSGYLSLSLDEQTGKPKGHDSHPEIALAKFFEVTSVWGSKSSGNKIDIAIDGRRNMLYLGSRIENKDGIYEGLLEVVKLNVTQSPDIFQSPAKINSYFPGFNSYIGGIKELYDQGDRYQFFTFHLVDNGIIPHVHHNMCYVHDRYVEGDGEANGLCIWPLKKDGYPRSIGSKPIFDQPKYIPKTGKIQSIAVDRVSSTVWIAEDSMFNDAVSIFSNFGRLAVKNGFSLRKFSVDIDGSITEIALNTSEPFHYRLDVLNMICDSNVMPITLCSNSYYYSYVFPTRTVTKFIGNQVLGHVLGVRAFKVTNDSGIESYIPIENAKFCITNTLSGPCNNELSNRLLSSEIPNIPDSDKFTWFFIDSFLTYKTGQQLIGINVISDQVTNESNIRFEAIVYGPTRSTALVHFPTVLFRDNDKVTGKQILLLVPGCDFIIPGQQNSEIEWRSKHSQRMNQLSSNFKVVKRPKDIIISAWDVNGFQGHTDQLAMELDTLSNLGFNTTNAFYWNDFGNNWWGGLTGSDVRRMLEASEFRVQLSIGKPMGLNNTSWAACFDFEYKFFEQHTVPGCSCKNETERIGMLKRWLCERLICDNVKAIDLKENKISLIDIADEPTWHYPQEDIKKILQLSSNSIELHDNLFNAKYYALADWINFLINSGTIFPDLHDLIREYDENRDASFRIYLSHLGFEPGHFGVNNWSDPALVPTFRSDATSPNKVHLYYWTIRFFTESASLGLKTYVREILSQLGIPTSPHVFMNSNIAPWYVKQGEEALGHFDFFYHGRNSTICPCIEDLGVIDRHCVDMYPYYSDLLRSSSMLSHDIYNSNKFVALLHNRDIGHHQTSPSYRILSSIGHGTKAIVFYRYNEGFVGQLSDQWSNRPEIFKQIADANKLVGEADEILAAGNSKRGVIALLSPYSSKLWDDMADSIYENEIRFLHTACIHYGYTLDIIDESDVLNGVLFENNPQFRDYRVLYIVGPNLSNDVQKNIIRWVKEEGGIVAVMPGAAIADEYNNKTILFNDLLGLQDQNRNRINEPLQSLYEYSRFDLTVDSNLVGFNVDSLRIFGPVRHLIPDNASGNLEELASLRIISDPQIFKAITVRKYDSGGGKAIAYAFLPGIQFWQSQYYEGPIYDNKYEFPRFSQDQLRIANIPLIIADPEKRLKTIKISDINGEVFGVESCLLETTNGDKAIILLNWTNNEFQSLTLDMADGGPFNSISSAKGAPLILDNPIGINDISIIMRLSDVDILILKR